MQKFLRITGNILKICLLIVLIILPILFCGIFIYICHCRLDKQMDVASWATLIGGVIAYYGSLILGLIAVYQNVKQRESDEDSQQRLEKINEKLLMQNESISNETARKNVLPFIGLTHIHYEKHTQNVFHFNDDNNPMKVKETLKNGVSYEELDIKYFCAQIDEQGITFYKTETKGVKDFKHHIGKTEELGAGITALVQRDDAYIPFKLKNIGFNVAVNFNFSFFKEGFENIPWAFHTVPRNLSVNDELRFDIYIPNKTKVQGKYILQLSYYDILSNQYEQNFEIFINEDNVQLSIAHTQILINQTPKKETN